MIKIAQYIAIILLTVSIPAHAEWEVFTTENEMTGALTVIAMSPYNKPTEAMGFPYDGIRASLVIACREDSNYVYIHFNRTPNLADASLIDDHYLINTKVKWDSMIDSNAVFWSKMGSKALHFEEYGQTISNIENSKSVLVEIKWFGEGSVYFRFSLLGSSTALDKTRQQCSVGIK